MTREEELESALKLARAYLDVSLGSPSWDGPNPYPIIDAALRGVGGAAQECCCAPIDYENLEGQVVNRGRFNDQFRETFDETQDRWRATRAKRKAEGKCWQCAKLIAVCTCPNVNHAGAVSTPGGQS